MKIAVFGDKLEFADLKKKIEFFNDKHKTKLNCLYFENFENFLKEKNNEIFNLIFFLYPSEKNSILNLVKNLKKNNPTSKIVFCSQTEKFAVVGYKIGFSYYLLLPLNQEELNFALEKLLNLEKKIIIKSNWQKIPIFINEIHFAEKQGHNVIIHTTEKTFSTRSSFKEFIKNFEENKNFIHCIRGTIVNLNWVESISLQNFIMKNGEKIPIRRQDKKRLKDLFFKFNLSKNFENF